MKVEKIETVVFGNKDEVMRMKTVVDVATVCTGKDSCDVNTSRLYERLLKENAGKPSSAFEFVPVLLNYYFGDNTMKYSQTIPKSGKILTNLRACLMDKGGKLDKIPYNTREKELELINLNYFCYKLEIPIFIARQLVRHRTLSFQELSRRYTKKNVKVFKPVLKEKELKEYTKVVEEAISVYNKLLTSGVKLEVARMVLPVSLCTTIYIGGFAKDWANFFSLRLDKHTQFATRKVAKEMFDLLSKEQLENMLSLTTYAPLRTRILQKLKEIG